MTSQNRRLANGYQRLTYVEFLQVRVFHALSEYEQQRLDSQIRYLPRISEHSLSTYNLRGTEQDVLHGVHGGRIATPRPRRHLLSVQFLWTRLSSLPKSVASRYHSGRNDAGPVGHAPFTTAPVTYVGRDH